jgi:TfoX/Sxy family transcriptional regulator of competence genes
MAYDENLAQRVREIMAAEEAVTERKMFGGLAFMLAGNMACGILGEELMLRLGPDGAETALASKHVRPMDFTGRPMKGMVFVAPAGLKGAALRRWVAKAIAFASGLPPKGGTPTRAFDRDR